MTHLSALHAVATAPGATFNAKTLIAAIDGATFISVAKLLRRWSDAGLVRFTGRVCVWERVA